MKLYPFHSGGGGGGTCCKNHTGVPLCPTDQDLEHMQSKPPWEHLLHDEEAVKAMRI